MMKIIDITSGMALVEANMLFGDMREMSKEEQAFIKKNLDKISQPTEVSFWA